MCDITSFLSVPRPFARTRFRCRHHQGLHLKRKLKSSSHQKYENRSSYSSLVLYFIQACPTLSSHAIHAVNDDPRDPSGATMVVLSAPSTPYSSASVPPPTPLIRPCSRFARLGVRMLSSPPSRSPHDSHHAHVPLLLSVHPK